MNYRHRVQKREEATERDLKKSREGVVTFTGSQGVGPTILNQPAGSPFLNNNEHALNIRQLLSIVIVVKASDPHRNSMREMLLSPLYK